MVTGLAEPLGQGKGRFGAGCLIARCYIADGSTHSIEASAMTCMTGSPLHLGVNGEKLFL
ncbi:hypothetical protein A9Q95_14450 [Rhodobacterales bacterium 59_46_T64]|nr:hypothetical protein A9Q95_14450 [Rhodobacterales bacterium 59_46_T64]